MAPPGRGRLGGDNTVPGQGQSRGDSTGGNTATQQHSNSTADTRAMDNLDPGSAQYQYRKVMKPLLERKRRARINGCLDELKELMEYLGAEQQQGGQRMQRLEKADVLEVTVNHLRQLKASGRLSTEGAESLSGSSTFRSGYSACAAEVASFICAPGSGVQQPQAASIAMVVARGLAQVQQEQPAPAPAPAPALAGVKTESSSEPQDSAPLDLTVKL